jgi:hypothetical protein
LSRGVILIDREMRRKERELKRLEIIRKKIKQSARHSMAFSFFKSA